ncbi:Mitogen-Activated Protein Kinase Kinase Kinase 8 [Stygiomarasmius scandens]|uniref:Mitogen-Activated Protein Kinase Kinase Kinase 8 n=1 Tax=Marasmiellus scandens TaxID=2682957 RepID=A0ABR1IXP2_9AGAR
MTPADVVSRQNQAHKRKQSQHPTVAEHPYYMDQRPSFSAPALLQTLPIAAQSLSQTTFCAPASSFQSWSPATRTKTWSVHERLNAIPSQALPHPSINQSPPQHSDPKKLYASVPLPAQVDPCVDVILFLRTGSGLGLDLDLGMTTTELGLQGGRGSEMQRYLGVPATNPPIPSMTVVHPTLPWPITVYFSRSAYVTVWDVLVTIVESLRKPIRPTNGERRRQRGDGDAWTRVACLPGRRLIGLRKSERGEDVWLMDVV